jgi:hypothetical protein
VDTIQFRIGTGATWKDFATPQKILYSKEAHLLATNIQPPGVTLPAGMPTWEGTFGASGTGLEVSHTYRARRRVPIRIPRQSPRLAVQARRKNS